MEELNCNSNEMKTEVETFLIEEVTELIYDLEKLDEWNKYVKELSLIGQTEIVKKEKSPIPFLCMNEELKETFETLCPRKVLISDFNITPIPLEILKLVSLSQKEKYFERGKIEIWYDKKDKDPVCVGIIKKYRADWDSVNPSETKGKEYLSKEEAESNGVKKGFYTDSLFYLIGRWADVKQSFNELKKKAKQRFIEENTKRYESTIEDYKEYLRKLPKQADDKFGVILT